MALVRMNISSSEEVRDWYKVQAEEYGMSMSALMSFVLTQYKKNEESRELLKGLSSMANIANPADTENMINGLKDLLVEYNKSGLDDNSKSDQ